MSRPRPVIVLAPRHTSLARFGGRSLEARLTVQTRDGAPASLTNLEALINSPLERPRLSRGIGDANPLAGYLLESILKRHGYAARTVFDWADDTALAAALAADPLALLFSTTFVTDPGTLAACLGALRRLVGDLPLVVGGLYVHKQARSLAQDADDARRRALAELGVDADADMLFGPRPDPRTTDAIYVAAEHGAATALGVLARIERGARRPADFAAVPNLVLPTAEGGWQPTARQPEPFDLDDDYVRWGEIDELPAALPVRTSVGCPCRCRFCDFHLIHPHAKLRSIASIVTELAEAVRLGRSFVSFVDDNIFPTGERAAALARGIVEAELDVVWGGFFRADQVGASNVAAIRESGCRFGFCGIESADPGQLEEMRREGDPEHARAGIELCADAGIDIIATFLVGFPGETRATLDRTAELLNRFPVLSAGATAFEIYPFYLSPGTVADAPAFRRRHDLRGRHGGWSHRTMTAREAVEVWSPYLFRGVRRVPYNYQTVDAPTWRETDWRLEAQRRRRALTIGFLDHVDDSEIQRLFAELYGWISSDSEAGTAPSWRSLLAERPAQPGGFARD